MRICMVCTLSAPSRRHHSDMYSLKLFSSVSLAYVFIYSFIYRFSLLSSVHFPFFYYLSSPTECFVLLFTIYCSLIYSNFAKNLDVHGCDASGCPTLVGWAPQWLSVRGRLCVVAQSMRRPRLLPMGRIDSIESLCCVCAKHAKGGEEGAVPSPYKASD